MSTSPTPSSSSIRSKKVVIPKVWKRPHSTIYGKNVEFGSSLYSDKIGELNGRKFNSELPWSMRQRNSGTSSSSAGTSSSSSGTYSQGYLSNLLLVDSNDPLLNHLFASSNKNNYSSAQHSGSNNSSSSGGNYHSSNDNYADMLELTNPARISKRNNQRKGAKQSMLNNLDGSSSTTNSNKRIDFYDQYTDFNDEINHMKNSSLLYNEPLLTRKVLNNFLDFDYDLGLFVPNHYNSRADRSLIRRSTYSKDYDNNSDINSNYLYCPNTNTVPSSSSSNYKFPHHSNHIHRNTTPTPNFIASTTKLLPKHECQLISSPYGQSNDGRKLSLGSINPHSYRPSLPQKTTTAHASDGEEFEFQDKSSPFYTDR